jgi:hypothetical protein
VIEYVSFVLVRFLVDEVLNLDRLQPVQVVEGTQSQEEPVSKIKVRAVRLEPM